MALYHNTVQWVWDLEAGEHVAWLRYPFKEYNLESIFKILAIYDDHSADIEVVDTVNPSVIIGHIYEKQPLIGFRRVKVTTIKHVLDKVYSPSGTLPTPREKERIEYDKEK